MLKSINLWAFPGGLAGEMDPVEAMEQAAELGFEGIELCFGSAGKLTDKTSQERCAEIKEAAKSIGVKIVSTATGQLWAWSLTDRKAAVREKARRFMEGVIERTRWLGTDATLVIPGCVHADFIPNCPELPYDFVYKTALQQLKRLARKAAKARVHVCVENVWNKFLYSPLEMKAFIDAVGNRWAGAYFDVGNPVAFGIPEHWIAILGRRIKRVHFKDYKRARRDDGTVYPLPFPEGFDVPMGQGDINWVAVIRALKKIRYKGPVTAEVLNFADDPDLVERISDEMNCVLKRRPRKKKVKKPAAATADKASVSAEASAPEPAAAEPAPAGEVPMSLAGWSLHRRFLRKTDPLRLLDYPGVVREEFGLNRAELNSPFFEYADFDDLATSPVRDGYVRELRQCADDTGVELVGIAVDDRGDLCALDEDQRLQAVANHRIWFDVCRELSCIGFRANSGGGDQKITSAHVDQCTRSFGQLAEWAQQAGVKVMMENHWGLSADPHRMIQVIRDVNSPWFGALPDFGNFPPEVDKYQALELLVPYAFFVHAKYTAFDADGEDPNVDTARIMRIFRDAGYEGLFGIEFEGEGDDHDGVLKSKALIERHAY